MKKTTTLDYIILGLIQQNPLSGYRIRKSFEETALGNFGGSPGTIYPALKRLEKNELISKQSIGDSSKSQYSITQDGLNLLRHWLGQLPSLPEIKKNQELLILKFAFMDPMIKREQQIEYLNSMKQGLENYLAELQDFFLAEKVNMPVTGRLAFEHGFLSYKATMDWCDLAKKSLDNT